METNDRVYLSVETRWLTTAHASSGRAFLITRVQSRDLATHGWRIAYALTPPPTISTALVVPTKELINGSRKIADSTTLRASSDVVESKIAFFRAWSISAEWTAEQRRVS